MSLVCHKALSTCDAMHLHLSRETVEAAALAKDTYLVLYSLDARRGPCTQHSDTVTITTQAAGGDGQCPACADIAGRHRPGLYPWYPVQQPAELSRVNVKSLASKPLGQLPPRLLHAQQLVHLLLRLVDQLTYRHRIAHPESLLLVHQVHLCQHRIRAIILALGVGFNRVRVGVRVRVRVKVRVSIGWG